MNCPLFPRLLETVWVKFYTCFVADIGLSHPLTGAKPVGPAILV